MIWSARDTIWKPEFHVAYSLKAQSASSLLMILIPPRVSKKLSTFEEDSDAFDVFWFFISGSLGIL